MQQYDLNRLWLFRELARAGSLSKAALSLKQPKSRLSRQLAALERDLGVRLVNRTTRHFQLTPAGQELILKATPALETLRSALEGVSSSSAEISGVIKMTAPEDLGNEMLGSVIHDFSALYPRVSFDLHIGNRNVDLVRESFDLAVRVGGQRDSSLVRKRIGSVHSFLVASPQWLTQNPTPRNLDDLEDHPVLAFSPQDTKRYPVKLTNGRESKTVRLLPVLSANNFYVLRSLALQGHGITLLPMILARGPLAQGTLLPILAPWRTEDLPLQCLMPQQADIPLRVRRFADFLVQALAPTFT